MLVAKVPTLLNRMKREEIREEYDKLSAVYNDIRNGVIYRCPHCGEFNKKDEFYVRPDYALGIYPICKKCLLSMATDYDPAKDTYVDNKEKAMRIFNQLDLPFMSNMYDECLKNVAEGNIVRGQTAFQQMISVVNALPAYRKMSWADSDFANDTMDQSLITNRKPRKEIVKLFGAGFTTGDYLYLQDQFDDFKARTQVDSKSQEIYVTQICLQLLDIDKDRKQGRDVTKKLAALDSFMASAKLQPKQNVNNAATDSLTFSQLLEKWEIDRPVSEPAPEFRDVDGIGHLLKVFFGWICKALGIKNVYTQSYEDEANAYAVQKPEESEEYTDNNIYSQIFTKDGE